MCVLHKRNTPLAPEELAVLGQFASMGLTGWMIRVDQDEALGDLVWWDADESNVDSKIRLGTWRELAREMPTNGMSKSLLTTLFQHVLQVDGELVVLDDSTRTTRLGIGIDVLDENFDNVFVTNHVAAIKLQIGV